MQSNAVCDFYKALYCIHLEIPLREGLWCNDYSASIKCCESHCAVAPPMEEEVYPERKRPQLCFHSSLIPTLV